MVLRCQRMLIAAFMIGASVAAGPVHGQEHGPAPATAVKKKAPAKPGARVAKPAPKAKAAKPGLKAAKPGSLPSPGMIPGAMPSHAPPAPPPSSRRTGFEVP